MPQIDPELPVPFLDTQKDQHAYILNDAIEIVVGAVNAATGVIEGRLSEDELAETIVALAGSASVGTLTVYFGSDLATPRPDTTAAVMWVGQNIGRPTYAIAGDLVPRVVEVDPPADPDPEPTVYFSDNFNRADGAPGASPVGAITPAVSGTATPTIVSNQLTFSPSSGTAYVTWDTGHADGVFKAKVPAFASAANGLGILFRFMNATNHLLLTRVSGSVVNWRLIKRVASSTAVDVFVSSVPIAVNDTFEITMSGTTISILLNGVAFWSGTVTDHATNTKHGVIGTSTFDDLSFTALG